MFFGVAYWAVWRILLPKVFRYELVPRKETLKDGTVVTLVRTSTDKAEPFCSDRTDRSTRTGKYSEYLE